MSTAAEWPAGGPAGWIDGMTHVLPIRVYYEDTDAGGIVYYANYLKYAERARTDLLRLVGIEQSEMTRQHRVAFAVRKCVTDYLAPARLDDLVEVRSQLLRLGGATVNVAQEIGCDGKTLTRLEVRLGCMSLDGGPARLPQSVRRALEPYCGT